MYVGDFSMLVIYQRIFFLNRYDMNEVPFIPQFTYCVVDSNKGHTDVSLCTYPLKLLLIVDCYFYTTMQNMHNEFSNISYLGSCFT